MPNNLTEHPTIGPTLECFAEVCHKLKLSRVPCSHPLSSKQPNIGIHIHHLLQDGKLLTLEHMNTLWAAPNLRFLEYWQIKQYINSTQCKIDLSEALTSFENLCLSHMPQRHVISKIHNMLWYNAQADEGIACKAWAKDLNITLTNISWEKIYQNVHKGSINVFIQENNYKIISQWYCTSLFYTDLMHPAQINAGDVDKQWAISCIFGGIPNYPHLLETGP